MKRFAHSVSRTAIVLIVAAWSQVMAHTVACHNEDALCDHSQGAESAVCVCVCHTAMEPAPDAPVYVSAVSAFLAPVLNETVRALLLPDDIFRPPLALS